MSTELAPGLPLHVVADIVTRALDEDLGAAGDVTTSATIDAHAVASADLVPRADGVVAGLPIAAYVFEVVGRAGCASSSARPTAPACAPGEVLATIRGPVRDLLTAERTALNLLCHLSGIATLTRRWVDAVAGTGARIRDTRKTMPGLRALEKYAVRCGGGLNHRMSLSDAALVKDNHVAAAGGVARAFELVRAAHPELVIEIEVDTVEQAREVIDAGAQLVLLDNMSPDADERRRSRTRPGGPGSKRPVGCAWTTRVRSPRRASTTFQSGRSRTPRRYWTSDWTSRPRVGRRAMLLAIDIGNTNTVLGVFEGEKLERSLADQDRRAQHGRRAGADLPRPADRSRDHRYRGVLDRPSGAARAARHARDVLPAHPDGARRARESAPGSACSTRTRRRSAPTASSTPWPRTTSCTGPAIVVDFGTTTNFDVVSAKGEFLGGALAPGIEISLDALAARAAQLRKVELVAPRGPIGKSTVEALQSGILYGFAGQVDGLVRRLTRGAAPGGPRGVDVIATGGLATLVIEHCETVTRYEPDLTLLGLRLIYERNI